MAKTHSPHAPEYRQQMVELVATGRSRSRALAAARESGELIGVITAVVGARFFTSLSEFDGLALNAAAGRPLGLDETQTQWLGASAWEGGPYWDEQVTGRDVAEVCREVARGEDARDAWYARRMLHLSLKGHYPSFPREVSITSSGSKSRPSHPG